MEGGWAVALYGIRGVYFCVYTCSDNFLDLFSLCQDSQSCDLTRRLLDDKYPS